MSFKRQSFQLITIQKANYHIVLVNYLSHYSYVTLYYRNTFIELFNFNDNSFKPNIQYWVLNVTLVISEYDSLGCIPSPSSLPFNLLLRSRAQAHHAIQWSAK